MRWVVLGITMLSLSGCGLVAIPPALTVASYAVDGVSYLVSGKSLTDHAVSEVAGADCAMWRLIKAQNPCLNDEGEAETLVAFEGEPYDPPPHMNEPDFDWAPVDPAAGGELEQVALAPAVETVAAASAPEGTAGADEEGGVPNVLPAAGPLTRGVPNMPVKNLPAPAPVTLPVRAAEPVAPAPVGDPRGGGQLLAVAGGSVEDADLTQLAALPMDDASAPAADERRFLVIGSFLELANAERLVRRHPRLDPVIAPAVIGGERYWRVVTETATAEGAGPMRRWLARNGFATAWPIAACAAGTSAPGCLSFGDG